MDVGVHWIHALLACVLLIVVSLSHTEAFSYFRPQTKKELWPYLRIKCDIDCPYGFQTDLEGNSICKCHDPCMNVFCLGGTRCVVHFPKTKACAIQSSSCKPIAVCKDTNFQNDGSTSSRIPDTCTAPVYAESKCLKKRKRWFYNEQYGKCMKYFGCEMEGNSFPRKRLCKKECYRKRRKNRKYTRRWRQK